MKALRLDMVLLAVTLNVATAASQAKTAKVAAPAAPAAHVTVNAPGAATPIPVKIFGWIVDTSYAEFRVSNAPSRDTLYLPVTAGDASKSDALRKEMGMKYFKGTILGGKPAGDVFGRTHDVHAGQLAYPDPIRTNEFAIVQIVNSRLSPNGDTLGIAISYSCGRLCAGGAMFMYVRKNSASEWQRKNIKFIKPDYSDQYATTSRVKPTGGI